MALSAARRCTAALPPGLLVPCLLPPKARAEDQLPPVLPQRLLHQLATGDSSGNSAADGLSPLASNGLPVVRFLP